MINDVFSSETIDRAAKALWDSETHVLLESRGYPIDYESQPRVIKNGLRRRVRAVIEALCA